MRAKSAKRPPAGSPWGHVPYPCAREAARASASAAAVPERLLEPLELAFFGWRIGQRLDNPKFYPTTAGTAVRMLESVAREPW